eukprot:3519681-Ditylum_brightwellii.AAC.1
MKYLSEAIGTISLSQSSLLLSIIIFWAHVTHMARRNLLSKQHLVGLMCFNATSKKLLIIYLPQVEVMIDEDSDTDEEWITSSTSDSADRLQSVKVLAIQLFYDFDELARPFDDFPTHLMGGVIEDIPEMDSIIPPFGDNNLCIISISAVIL